MNAKQPHEFKHTTLTAYPKKVVGVKLLEEEPGFTGIYLEDANGGLWPARTVNQAFPEHHREVCDAWLSRNAGATPAES